MCRRPLALASVVPVAVMPLVPWMDVVVLLLLVLVSLLTAVVSPFAFVDVFVVSLLWRYVWFGE